MPISLSPNYAFLGAALIGVISAAAVFIIQQYEQEKQKQKHEQDIARLERQLQCVKNSSRDKSQPSKIRKLAPKTFSSNYSGHSAESIESTASGVSEFSAKFPEKSPLEPHYASTYDSSDAEFYDVSDDESIQGASASLESILHEIDTQLDEGSLEAVESALIKLQTLNTENPSDSRLLWRLGKAHHRKFDKIDPSKREERKALLFKGIEFCEKSLELKDDVAEAHKWYAILIGEKGEFQSIKEKIASSLIFKQHVEAALEYDPHDPVVHHMLGRLMYELSNLTWIERKVVETVYGRPTTATFEQALEHFRDAEELSQNWKANKLYLAKTYIALNQLEQGKYWIKLAKKLSDHDRKTNAEVDKLYDQYILHAR